MLPGIPAWPLSPGIPCGKGKESHHMYTYLDKGKHQMKRKSHRLTGSPLSPGVPGIPGTPGVPA